MDKNTFEFIELIAKDGKRVTELSVVDGQVVSGNQAYFIIENHLFRQMIEELRKVFNA